MRSDSVSAITLIVHCKASGLGFSLIAREAALDIAEGVYRPSIDAHVPGVSNIIAVILSRWDEPGSKRFLPPALALATESTAEERIRTWWRKLFEPPPRRSARQ